MDIYKLLDTMTKEDIDEALRYLPDLNKAGLIKEFAKRVIAADGIPSISDAMYYAYYDLMIDSETGKFKLEYQNLFPSTGKDTIF